MTVKLEILPILLITALLPAGAAASTYYVSSTSTTSSPCSQSQPCKPDNVWSSVAPGDTVIFKDGTYKGAGYMLDPPSNESGTQSNPITVRAESDGGVLFDGQFGRIPIYLNGNSWFILEGFNACCSSAAVIDVHSGSDHNTIRRVIGWDAVDSGNGVIDTALSDYNLFEDCAGFGVGRKTFTGSEGNHTIWRRTWARWEGNTVEGPKMTYTLYYQATNRLCENCLGTWDNGSMPATYYLVDYDGNVADPDVLNGCSEVNQARGGMSADRHDTEEVINAAVMGSIFYLRGATSGTQNCFSGSVAFFNLNAGSARDDGFTIENVAIYIDPSNSGHDDVRALRLGPGSESAGPPNDLYATDISSISKLPNMIDAEWATTDIQYATTVAGLGDSIYTGNGAHICYRYINGVEQVGQKLWPWPMQDRILAATTLAASPAHQHMMNVCTSSSCSALLVTDPHKVGDVMGDIVAMFGPVPAACLGDTGGGNPDDPPPAPDIWRTDTE